MAAQPDITALLGDWSRGERAAPARLLLLVYAKLRRVAARQLRLERADHTLQPTARIHEVYLRLVDQRQVGLLHRGHFYAVAADVMRRAVNRVCRRIAPAQLMTGISVPTGRRLGEVQAPIAQRVVALNQRGS